MEETMKKYIKKCDGDCTGCGGCGNN